jgi:hypothetical protein
MNIRLALAVAILAITPAAAMAQSQAEQDACMDDAFNVCGHAIPDRDRVAACLAANLQRISSGCRTVMLRYAKSPERPSHTNRNSSKPNR